MPGRFDEVVATPPSILHGDDGLVLDGGDVTIELIHTPGHCADHVSLYLREPRILLAGDAAEVPFPHIDTPEGLVQARASLERLVALGATYVLPCHGGTTDPVVLERNIAWIDAVTADPGAALRGGARAVRRRPLRRARDVPLVPRRRLRRGGPGARLTRPGASGMID